MRRWMLVGALFGAATGAALVRLFPRRVLPLAAPALVVAAAIYPAARRPGSGDRAALTREVASVLVGTGIAVAGVARGGAMGTAMVTAGWLGHAGFDFLHHRGPGSCLPDWYAPLCAGYDVAFAAVLAGMRPATA